MAVVAYDDQWLAAFADERDRVQVALDEVLVGDVEHIGSTSVVGMVAKPIIDMMAPVRRLEDANEAEGLLAPLGYVRRPHRIDAIRFIKLDVDASTPTHHLHLTEVGSDLWLERITFRDALRSSAQLRDEYAALKAALIARSPNGRYRAADKREFVRRVLSAAGHTLRDDRHENLR